ncbi:MAG: hypothetical protein R3B70_00030 [Polyangiaceae bacterium]
MPVHRAVRSVAPFLLALPLLAGCATPLAAAPLTAAPPAETASRQNIDSTDPTSRGALAREAVSEDRESAAAAIARLRAAGQPGLDSLFRAHAEVITRLGSPEGPAADPEALRVREALEKVARQRDAHASRLYWHTDLASARAAARASGKPILSLRLLGNLDEELSCANSRFFRTALYPNTEVGAALRSRFVLHWKSERPAPLVTVDFGDGRKLTRTVTGNSIHYVLDPEGRVVDAVPGMYGAKAFLRALDAAESAYRNTREADDETRREALRSYHAERAFSLASGWAALLGVPIEAPLSPVKSDDSAPPANLAVMTAVPKAAVEAPIVQAVQATPVIPLPDPSNAEAWTALIDSFEQEVRLDAASRAFMRSKIAADIDLDGKAMKPLDDASFEKKLRAFERAIAEDTARNEYGMHRVLHGWMAMTPPPEELEAFNERVYASLFLTPRSDPWLGLLVKEAYSGIEREGVRLGGGGRAR